MQATTGDIIRLIDKEASFDCAEDWDNSGLQAGSSSWKVKKVLIALDPALKVLEEAVKINADLVLTHHPLFINAPKCIDFNSTPGHIISICARNNISIVSAHTNLDKADNGLNDYFAKVIGLTDIHSLHNNDDNPCSFGRKGNIEKKIPLKDFAFQIKEKLNLDYIRVVGKEDLLIKSVVVITGSGGSMIEDFFQSQADVFVTGDVKYHEARVIEDNNSGMIDVGHFGSEIISIQLLADKIINAVEKTDYDFEIFKYENESDPFNIV